MICYLFPTNTKYRENYENSKEVSAVLDQIIAKRDEEEKMFTIQLVEPVLLSPGARYTARVRISGPKSWEGQNYKSYMCWALKVWQLWVWECRVHVVHTSAGP